jgi:hypothetical protein
VQKLNTIACGDKVLPSRTWSRSDRGRLAPLPDEAAELLPSLQAALGEVLPRWYSTALRLMNSSAAISGLDSPFPTRWATSVSRLVSAKADCFLAGSAGRLHAASSSSVRAMNGAARSIWYKSFARRSRSTAGRRWPIRRRSCPWASSRRAV